MTQPAMPQQLLIAQANGLAMTERAFPLGPPPISIAQALSSIAASIPQAGLPVPGTIGPPGATGLPFPTFARLPLGGEAILANLDPRRRALGPLRPALGPLRGAANGSRVGIFPRTGLG